MIRISLIKNVQRHGVNDRELLNLLTFGETHFPFSSFEISIEKYNILTFLVSSFEKEYLCPYHFFAKIFSFNFSRRPYVKFRDEK